MARVPKKAVEAADEQEGGKDLDAEADATLVSAEAAEAEVPRARPVVQAASNPKRKPTKGKNMRTAADLFDEAADALLDELYVITDPKLLKGNLMDGAGNPVYMNEAEMYDEYNRVISTFANTVLENTFGQQCTICARYVRKVRQAADNVRFPPSEKPRSSTVLLQLAKNLRGTIAVAKARCRTVLEEAKLLQLVG